MQLSPGQPPRPERGGFPLAAPVLQRMESLFGTPLDAVRIHVGPHVAALGAHALTQGDDIHFAPGHYNPSSARGSQLLVEQLAIVQDPAIDREARAFAVAQPYFSFRGSELWARNQRVKDARARIQDQGTLDRFNRAFSDARNHGTPASWLPRRSAARAATRSTT